MERVGAYTQRATADGEWRPGDPATGQQATPMLAQYFNMLQRELVKAVEDAGLVLDPLDEAQLSKAVHQTIDKVSSVPYRTVVLDGVVALEEV